MEAKFEDLIHHISLAIESLGILIIICGLVYSFVTYFRHLRAASGESFQQLRQNLGKTILLGLEVLVVADIVGTVMVKTTMDRILVLCVIVAIRIILSLSIQVEIEGQFPWKKKERGDM
jgi:uncharacterized membrane protein